MTISIDQDAPSRLRVETVHREDAFWLVLRGEADIATLEQLEDALAHVELDRAKPVHLHLTDLDFADVATLRELTNFARQAKQAGHDIKTCGATPTLRKVALLLSLHQDLGIS